MILLAAAFLAGDAWTWDVALRYADADGPVLDDRERWTVRIGTGSTLVAERSFLGSVTPDGTFVPTSDPRPETAKGRVEADGTLSLDGKWSDPDTNRVLRRLLAGEKGLGDRVAGWSVVRRATLREADVWLPGGVTKANLRVDVSLLSARLGGETIPIRKS